VQATDNLKKRKKGGKLDLWSSGEAPLVTKKVSVQMKNKYRPKIIASPSAAHLPLLQKRRPDPPSRHKVRSVTVAKPGQSYNPEFSQHQVLFFCLCAPSALTLVFDGFKDVLGEALATEFKRIEKEKEKNELNREISEEYKALIMPESDEEQVANARSYITSYVLIMHFLVLQWQSNDEDTDDDNNDLSVRATREISTTSFVQECGGVAGAGGEEKVAKSDFWPSFLPNARIILTYSM
jgi:hypothetical protein